MKRKTTAGKRRFHHYPRRGYVMPASACLAQFAANLYFKLAAGTAAQREAAQEWRTIFLQLGRDCA